MHHVLVIITVSLLRRRGFVREGGPRGIGVYLGFILNCPNRSGVNFMHTALAMEPAARLL